MSLYKQKNPLSQRISESIRVLSKYPSHVPVVVDCDPKLGKIKKNKFLVPRDVSASYLFQSIRKQLTCDASTAIFIFCDDSLLCPTEMMTNIYDKYLDSKRNLKSGEEQDKFLYLLVQGENTFGNF